MIGVREGDLYKVPGHAIETLYPSQASEIKRETSVLSSPQPSGIVEDERVIFHQCSSDSKIESYKTSCLEKQREKANKPTFDLIKKPIEKLQGCSNGSHSLIQLTPMMRSQPNNKFGKMIYGKWFLAIRGSQL